jgi:SAM-dependent methyltransferase
MDRRTLSFYERPPSSLVSRFESAPGASRYFPLAFPPGCRVLDVGAGSGRDAAHLLALGHDVYALEPSAALRSAAIEHHAELRERITAGVLPDALPDAATLGGPFDGVLCSAVLQHLPRHALFDSVFALRGLTKPHGRVLVSFPRGGRELDAQDRDGDGRLYTPLAPRELQLLFERCGFATLGSWCDADSLGRPGIEWVTMLFDLHVSTATPVHVRGLL